MARRIYVGNLPWAYSSSDLEALFKQYGDVAAAEVIMDRDTGRSQGLDAAGRLVHPKARPPGYPF